jgi:hypothetical protein
MNSFIELFKNEWFYPVTLFLWLIGWWILDKVFPAFLKNYYDTRLELQKRDFLRRDKAAVIAELTVLLRSAATDDTHKDKIDKALLDLSLYLPPCLVHKLSHTVCQTGTAEDLTPLGLFIAIRSYMDGTYAPDKSKTLTADNIALTHRQPQA